MYSETVQQLQKEVKALREYKKDFDFFSMYVENSSYAFAACASVKMLVDSAFDLMKSCNQAIDSIKKDVKYEISNYGSYSITNDGDTKINQDVYPIMQYLIMANQIIDIREEARKLYQEHKGFFEE